MASVRQKGAPGDRSPAYLGRRIPARPVAQLRSPGSVRRDPGVAPDVLFSGGRPVDTTTAPAAIIIEDLMTSSPKNSAATPAVLDERDNALALEGFFEVALDMFCMLDFNGYFRRLNPAWERTLGFTREELMSRRFIEFVHPDDRDRTLNQNADVRGGGQARGFENRYLTKDGGYRWFLWNATPYASDRVIYSVARDITERKQAEDERAALVRALEESLAEVRTLREILPICSYCKKIRDDENYWLTVETYIARHTNSQFSHSICPGCLETIVEPELRKLDGR